jgi:hemerythrin-like domain-containing protein
MNLTEHKPSTMSSVPQSAPRSVSAGGRRSNVYRAPHKMLRFLLANLLVEMGRTTFGETAQIEPILVQLESALVACDSHIEHEDSHVRPILAGRAPNAVSTLDTEHAEHAEHVAELRALARSLGGATTAEARTSLGETLYLHVTVFVAETLAHMAYEERVVQPLVERLFTDEELLAIHGAIIASIPPAEMMVALQAMIPASNREERAEMLGNVRAGAGEGAFRGILQSVRGLLRQDDFADLCGRLGVGGA